MLEGHLEVVGAGVVGVGGDDGCRGHGLEGRAGLRVGRVRWDIGGVLGAVGAGGGCSAADALIHAVVEQIELGLEERKRGGGKKENTSQFRDRETSATFLPGLGCPVTDSLKGQRAGGEPKELVWVARVFRQVTTCVRDELRVLKSPSSSCSILAGGSEVPQSRISSAPALGKPRF